MANKEKVKSIIKDFEPEIGLVLGSGLGELADEVLRSAGSYRLYQNSISVTLLSPPGASCMACSNNSYFVISRIIFHFCYISLYLYFPKQNFEKIFFIISSETLSPVISPKHSKICFIFIGHYIVSVNRL